MNFLYLKKASPMIFDIILNNMDLLKCYTTDCLQGLTWEDRAGEHPGAEAGDGGGHRGLHLHSQRPQHDQPHPLPLRQRWESEPQWRHLSLFESEISLSGVYEESGCKVEWACRCRMMKSLFIKKGTMDHITSSCKSFMDQTRWRRQPRSISAGQETEFISPLHCEKVEKNWL